MLKFAAAVTSFDPRAEFEARWAELLGALAGLGGARVSQFGSMAGVWRDFQIFVFAAEPRVSSGGSKKLVDLTCLPRAQGDGAKGVAHWLPGGGASAGRSAAGCRRLWLDGPRATPRGRRCPCGIWRGLCE